ncbi:MAG TPA: hypothetical protein VFA41_18950 [Ktedonobacteraceae bacterium]|jgi:hypothetical protein|nr:hypothetical protein [Ktedonobacteraceae bacterium]
MNNQPFQTARPQQQMMLMLGLLALYLLVSLLAAFLAPHSDFTSLTINIIASLAIVGGIVGLAIYAARQMGWPLPEFLQVPAEDRDQNWRLLCMSLIAIVMPLLIIFARSLFH